MRGNARSRLANVVGVAKRHSSPERHEAARIHPRLKRLPRVREAVQKHARLGHALILQNLPSVGVGLTHMQHDGQPRLLRQAQLSAKRLLLLIDR